jgi:hypothetical protein
MLLHRERCLHISQIEGKVTDRMPLLRLKHKATLEDFSVSCSRY